jgi:hypothetical protein
MKLFSFLLVSAIFLANCTSPINPDTDELLDGTFTAIVENGNDFDGDALFQIYIPSKDGNQNISEDSVLFLTLKTGEFTNEREINGEITEYTFNIGLTLNSLWKTDINSLELGSTLIQNLFIQPVTLESHGIRSGTITIDKKTNDLLVGHFELIAVNNLNDEFDVTGEFRAIIRE